MKYFVLIVSCIYSYGMAIADEALAHSVAVMAVLDTSGSPHTVKTAGEMEDLRQLTYRTGESVTMISPDGTETPLMENAAVSGSVSWKPSFGGLWTVSNSVSGTATFTFRHSLFDDQPDIPQVVDDEELVDIVDTFAIGIDFTFTLLALPGLLDRLLLPDGYSIVLEEDGLYRLKLREAGLVWRGKPVETVIDTRLEGPDRTARPNKTWRVSYTGDGWLGVSSTVSELTVVSPSGISTSQNLFGTGVTVFRPQEVGIWTLILHMENGTTYMGRVSVFGQDFVISFR